MHLRRVLFGFLAVIAAITIIGIVISGAAALYDLVAWVYALYETSALRAWHVLFSCILLLFATLSVVALMEKHWGSL